MLGAGEGWAKYSQRFQEELKEEERKMGGDFSKGLPGKSNQAISY